MSTNKIIGLHGLPRSGKDTVASILIDMYGYERIAYADPLKRAAAILLDRPLSECNGEDGFDREAAMPEWGFSMRWFLQKFGTECLREQIATDFWTRRLLAEIAKRPPGSLIVVTDVRFDNETEALRSVGADIIEIRRPGATGSAHASDRPVSCDWSIDNSGTVEDLRRQVARDIRFHPSYVKPGPGNWFPGSDDTAFVQDLNRTIIKSGVEGVHHLCAKDEKPAPGYSSECAHCKALIFGR